MSGHTAFLRAVIAAPDDDLPRLIYADYLDERGDPRGEFIRVQLALAAAGGVGDAADALRRRGRDLLAAGPSLPNEDGARFDTNENAWLFAAVRPWHPWRTPASALRENAWAFRRGFVESVTCTLDQWHAYGRGIVRATPLRVVRLSDRRPERRRDGWYWLADRLPRREHAYVPAAVLRHVPGPEGDRRYASEVAAAAALSSGVLAWARADARDV